MDGIGVDHYAVLGLTFSGEECAKLSKQEITRAYRMKAKEVHPDKRLLMDDNRRKLFDDHCRINTGRVRRREEQDCELRSMWSDFKEREAPPPPPPAASAVDPGAKAREDEERRTKKKFDEEVTGIRGMFNSKRKATHYDHELEKILKVRMEKKDGNFFVSKRRKRLENLVVGGRFQVYEDSVLDKLRRFATN